MRTYEIISIQIAKLKFHQYQIRAVSPNLTLTKVTHYTVCGLQTSFALYTVNSNSTHSTEKETTGGGPRRLWPPTATARPGAEGQPRIGGENQSSLEQGPAGRNGPSCHGKIYVYNVRRHMHACTCTCTCTCITYIVSLGSLMFHHSPVYPIIVRLL